MSLFGEKVQKIDIMNFIKIIYRHHKAGRQLKDCVEEYDVDK